MHVGRLALDHLLYFNATWPEGLRNIRPEPGSKSLHLAVNLLERRSDVGIAIPAEPEDLRQLLGPHS